MPGDLVKLLPTLQKKGRLTNADVRRVLGVARNTAARLLGELAAASWLVHSGKRGAGAFSTPGSRLLHQLPTMQNTGEGGAMGTETDAMKP
jgi:DNA-binding IclR family transcriptional regulator